MGIGNISTSMDIGGYIIIGLYLEFVWCTLIQLHTRVAYTTVLVSYFGTFFLLPEDAVPKTSSTKYQ